MFSWDLNTNILTLNNPPEYLLFSIEWNGAFVHFLIDFKQWIKNNFFSEYFRLKIIFAWGLFLWNSWKISQDILFYIGISISLNLYCMLFGLICKASQNWIQSLNDSVTIISCWTQSFSHDKCLCALFEIIYTEPSTL